jgi:hypothetical protein
VCPLDHPQHVRTQGSVGESAYRLDLAKLLPLVETRTAAVRASACRGERVCPLDHPQRVRTCRSVGKSSCRVGLAKLLPLVATTQPQSAPALVAERGCVPWTTRSASARAGAWASLPAALTLRSCCRWSRRAQPQSESAFVAGGGCVPWTTRSTSARKGAWASLPAALTLRSCCRWSRQHDRSPRQRLSRSAGVSLGPPAARPHVQERGQISLPPWSCEAAAAGRDGTAAVRVKMLSATSATCVSMYCGLV